MRRPSLTSAAMLGGLLFLAAVASAPSFSPGAIAGRPADIHARTLQTNVIQVDAVSKFNTPCPQTGTSWSHTVGRGVQPILFVAVQNGSALHITATYGGAAMNFIGWKKDPGGNIGLSVFDLVAPVEGTAAVQLSDFSMIAVAISLFGVDQTSPLAGNTSGGVSGAVVQVNTNVADASENMALGFVIAQASSGVPGTVHVVPTTAGVPSSQQIEVQDIESAPASCDTVTLTAGSLPANPGPSRTAYMNWTSDRVANWAWRDFDLKPGQSDVCVNPDDPVCNGYGGTGPPPRAPPCTTFNCRLVETANASFVFLVYTVNLWVYIFLVMVVLAAVYVREQRKKNRKWPR